MRLTSVTFETTFPSRRERRRRRSTTSIPTVRVAALSEENEERRGDQRCGIGEGTEDTDVAVLVP